MNGGIGKCTNWYGTRVTKQVLKKRYKIALASSDQIECGELIESEL